MIGCVDSIMIGCVDSLRVDSAVCRQFLAHGERGTHGIRDRHSYSRLEDLLRKGIVY